MDAPKFEAISLPLLESIASSEVDELTQDTDGESKRAGAVVALPAASVSLPPRRTPERATYRHSLLSTKKWYVCHTVVVIFIDPIHTSRTDKQIALPAPPPSPPTRESTLQVVSDIDIDGDASTGSEIPMVSGSKPMRKARGIFFLK